MGDNERDRRPRGIATAEALQKGLASAIKIVITTFGITLIGGLIWVQVRRAPVVLEPFEVPEELQKRGLTGRVLASVLLDELRIIEDRADTDFFSESRFSSAWSPKAPDLQIGEQGFSVASLTQAVQLLTGRLQSVTGELVQLDQALELRLRSAGAIPLCYRLESELTSRQTSSSSPCVQVLKLGTSTSEEGLRQILKRAGEDLYLEIEPMIVAAATFRSDSVRCQEALGRALTNDAEEDDAWAYNLLGELLRKEKLFAEAEHHYRHALEADPELAQAYNNWALVLEEKGDTQAAIKLLRAAAIRNPRLAQVRTNLGRLLGGAGDFPEALRQHRKAIRLKPLDAGHHFNYADGLYIAQRYDEAIEAFEKVEVLDPNDTEASLKRGILVLCQQEQSEIAIRSFRRAAEAHPPRCGAYLGIRAIWTWQRQISRADAAQQQLIECLQERAWGLLRLSFR